ncbi:MAG: TetR/AcrR family transcriptional regulator, partial [Oscillospiraceae bacterium]|nr:TetR/AcrR family transcriptional regulator [Oscillospiraceae bacterium]
TFKEAINSEVTRVPYEDFSIYIVVQQSGISRGSFYQYFTNKEDISLYLLSEYNRKIIQKFIESLQAHNGDYFIGLEEAFRFSVRMFCYKGSRTYREHLFCNVEFYERIWRDNDFSAEKHPVLRQALNLIHYENLIVNNEEELRAFIKICMSLVARECITLIMTNAPEETACESFMEKLNLLKRAFQKENQ